MVFYHFTLERNKNSVIYWPPEKYVDSYFTMKQQINKMKVKNKTKQNKKQKQSKKQN